MAVLEVSDLTVAFGNSEILRGVSFSVEAGETLGVVGESGCGKSMTGLAVMGMIPEAGRVQRGSIKLNGREMIGMKEKDLRQIRGKQIALVMQDPFTSLNPMMKVGHQISEAFRLHQNMSAAEAWKASVEMLDRVGVPAPELSAQKYPHQMSGGQRQRVVIAIAFACKPQVLIADEPTTALDVTLQAQILRLLRDLKTEVGTAIVFISHDIGAIAALSDRIAVFYAGRIVESGESEAVLHHPQMPYTQALLDALPAAGKARLNAIGGQPPDFAKLPVGCAFGPRCPHYFERCSTEPGLITTSGTHQVACWRAEELVVQKG